MIIIFCEKCGRQMDEPGALVFGPPVKGNASKTHICVLCYGLFLTEWLYAERSGE